MALRGGGSGVAALVFPFLFSGNLIGWGDGCGQREEICERPMELHEGVASLQSFTR